MQQNKKRQDLIVLFTDSTGWKQTVEESSTTVLSGSAESFMEKENRAFFPSWENYLHL